ncbi:MAG: hypothetical protein AAGK09_05375 [Planctomycetota bacterium]
MSGAAMSGVVERRGSFRAALLVYAAGLAAIVCAGAWLMASPWATPAGDTADAWERAFTAVSAACGSGLAWRDPATRWTPAGQWLLMGVGQAGWLWTVAFGAGLLGSILGRGAWRTGAWAVVWCVVVQALLAAAAWGAWREAALAMMGLGWRLGPVEPGAAAVLGVILPAGLIGALGGGWWLWLARRGVTWRSYARVALGLTAGVFLVGVVAVGVAEALPGWFDRLGIGQTAGRVSAEGDVLAALGTAGTATMDAMGAGRGEVEPGSLWPGGAVGASAGDAAGRCGAGGRRGVAGAGVAGVGVAVGPVGALGSAEASERGADDAGAGGGGVCSGVGAAGGGGVRAGCAVV